MLTNYLKTTLRNLRHHAVYTAINILGLTVGMAVCLLIVLFVMYEYRFDSMHSNADRIYRINEIQTFGGAIPQHVALSMYTMGPGLQDEFSEIEAFSRFIEGPDILEYENEIHMLDKTFLVDPAVFDIFDFELLYGDPAQVLLEPNAIAITLETAQRIFGVDDPRDEVIYEVDGTPYTIKGILKNMPENSHLQFDALISISTMEEEPWMLNWGNNWMNTYVLLHEGTSPATMTHRFPEFLESKREGMTEQYEMYLQPLGDIHLGSTIVTHDYNNYQKFDRTYVNIFGMLALFILLLAAINFTNLSTARSSTRAREVGVRKAIGAHRHQLTFQFLADSIVQSVISFLFALIVSLAVLGFVNQLSGRELALESLFAIEVWPLILLGVVLIGGMAGLYPAYVLSAFKPVTVLKGKGAFSSRERGGWLKNSLVIAQFSIAIIMIIGTFLTYSQLDFLQNRNIGIDRDQVVVIPLSDESRNQYDVLREELARDVSVLGVTASFQRLGSNIHQWGLSAEDKEGVMQDMAPSFLPVRENYFEFYDIEIVEGRGFSEGMSADTNRAFIVNEAFVSEMGWEEPIGKRIYRGGDGQGMIVGVVRDFNFNSLHNEIAPLIAMASGEYMNELSIRIDGRNIEAALAHLETTWGAYINDRPFTYEFLDQHFAQLYLAEQRVSQIFGIIAGLAIFIACLGLLGLAAFAAQQRTKEMGIRKVLGASVHGIIGLMSKDFLKLVGVSILIASPIAYLAMRRWLEEFAFHIELTLLPFAMAGAIALLIAFLTVGIQSIKTATSNPVHALKHE